MGRENEWLAEIQAMFDFFGGSTVFWVAGVIVAAVVVPALIPASRRAVRRDRYFEVTDSGSVRYFRVDGARAEGFQVEVLRHGLWVVSPAHRTVGDFLAVDVDRREIRSGEVPPHV